MHHHAVSPQCQQHCLGSQPNQVAKLYLEDTRSDLGLEAEKMKYANKINGLVCLFIRLDFDETLKADILVMERIYLCNHFRFAIPQIPRIS